MPNPTKEQIDEAIAALPKATPGTWKYDEEDGRIYADGAWVGDVDQIGPRTEQEVDANGIIQAAAPALARRVVELDSDLTALRSLVRRMREALTGNSLWPAEVDALCDEADKAIGGAP
jgi:hypothetical protein